MLLADEGVGFLTCGKTFVDRPLESNYLRLGTSFAEPL
jgi:hypothetical protein